LCDTFFAQNAGWFDVQPVVSRGRVSLSKRLETSADPRRRVGWVGQDCEARDGFRRHDFPGLPQVGGETMIA